MLNFFNIKRAGSYLRASNYRAFMYRLIDVGQGQGQVGQARR